MVSPTNLSVQLQSYYSQFLGTDGCIRYYIRFFLALLGVHSVTPFVWIGQSVSQMLIDPRGSNFWGLQKVLFTAFLIQWKLLWLNFKSCFFLFLFFCIISVNGYICIPSIPYIAICTSFGINWFKVIGLGVDNPSYKNKYKRESVKAQSSQSTC